MLMTEAIQGAMQQVIYSIFILFRPKPDFKRLKYLFKSEVAALPIRRSVKFA